MSDTSFFHTFVDPEYYESLERYQPTPEYLDIAQRHLDSSWKVQRGGYWTHCSLKDEKYLEHGWKIHLSAATKTAVGLLERVVPLLVSMRVGFKFCSDPAMLRLSLNKNAPRTGAGKFVTIYPGSEEAFKTQVDELYRATEGMWGPYLLTDKPYKDSKVVFYRYGTHRALERVTIRGQHEPGMRAPDGTFVPDNRVPYFTMPPWVKDPFAAEKAPSPSAPEKTASAPATSGGGEVLLNKRYRIEAALKFNTSGGIYRAKDTQTGATVIIREARPLNSKEPSKDETFILLEKEARILKRLEPTGYTPRFVDLFQQWEHRFLVQEKLEAEALWGYSIGFSRASQQQAAGFFTRVRDTVIKIATALKTIHANGIVLRDLTRNNIMFTPDHRVKFIDLEFSYELDGSELHVPSWTNGHSSPEQRRWERPKPADDCYSLGALLLDQIVFTAPGLDLNREGTLRAFRQSLEDFHLPLALYEVVLGLLEPEPSQRWDLDRLITTLSAIPVPDYEGPLVPTGEVVPPRQPPPPSLVPELQQTLEGVSRFVLGKADYSRNDRLWPARGGVFSTNPLNLDYGAAGTALFLQRLNGSVPAEVTQWMLKQLDRHDCPPGLFMGLAGTALALYELGQPEAAGRLMDKAATSPLLHTEFDFFWGDAGWGVANLHFWRHTGEEKYLTRALEAGEYLMRTKKESEQGAYWEKEGEVRLGLGHGQSGPALFLTYLAQARPGEKFLETAVKAVDFEIANAQQLDDVLLWFPNTKARVGDPKSPHMRHGTAGVGTAVLRAWLATGETRLFKFAERCANTVRDRHSNKLWFNYGMSGYGEYLLDMYRLVGGDQYLNWAFFLAEGMVQYRFPKDGAITFPAEDLLRISCDLGGGNAGIGLFLHRLLHPEQAHFLLRDELLGLKPASKR
jgi:serine/threonine protein kinase